MKTSQGVRSNKEASNNPGLCRIKGEQSGVCSRNMTRYKFSSLSLITDKTPPHCHILVVHPALHISYILPRDPQSRSRSNKLVNSTLSCELVGNFISETDNTPVTLQRNSPWY